MSKNDVSQKECLNSCNIIVHETRGVDCIVYSHPNNKNYKHDWPRDYSNIT